jgi:hypothetical protein
MGCLFYIVPSQSEDGSAVCEKADMQKQVDVNSRVFQRSEERRRRGMV